MSEQHCNKHSILDQERKTYKLPLAPPTTTKSPSLPLTTQVSCF